MHLDDTHLQLRAQWAYSGDTRYVPVTPCKRRERVARDCVRTRAAIVYYAMYLLVINVTAACDRGSEMLGFYGYY